MKQKDFDLAVQVVHHSDFAAALMAAIIRARQDDRTNKWTASALRVEAKEES